MGGKILGYNTKYEKIINRETTKNMFDSLRMTHEGNMQVKETKTLALIQKYEAFKMEESDTIGEIWLHEVHW